MNRILTGKNIKKFPIRARRSFHRIHAPFGDVARERTEWLKKNEEAKDLEGGYIK